MIAVAPTSEADTADAGRAARTVQVSGQLVPLDLAAGTYRVIGELYGTWTIPPAEAHTYYQSATRLYQRGTEYFDGCVNLDGDSRCDSAEPRGHWRSDYIYWASFDRSGRLVEGRCVHPITGGDEAFTGARGILHMVDVYASTKAGSTSIYQGEVVLNAVKEEPVAATAPAKLVAPAAARGALVGC